MRWRAASVVTHYSRNSIGARLVRCGEAIRLAGPKSIGFKCRNCRLPDTNLRGQLPQLNGPIGQLANAFDLPVLTTAVS